jgi:DNA anti-recombination protein RmuC
MAAFQTEVAKLMEEAQFKQENEKIATSLAERFETVNTKLREQLNAKLQQEIQGVSDKCRHTEERL